MSKIFEQIEQKLRDGLKPVELEVEDQSARHAGHAGAQPGGETHFRVRIISEKFREKSRIERHRMVHHLLVELMNNPIHALSIEAFAPTEPKNN